MAEVSPTRLAAVVLPCLLAAACSSASLPRPQDMSGVNVVGIVIRNALNYTVSDVMVEVPATGRFAGCGTIQARTECRTSFTAVDYEKNALLVTWREHGELQATDEFVVELPDGAQAGDSLWLEVVIYNAGLAGARLVQP